MRRPELMVASTCPKAGPLALPAQDRAQPSSGELIEHEEGTRMRVLEVLEPASQCPIEIGDDTFEAVPARPSRLASNRILETVQAFLANNPPSGIEPVAEELEPFPMLPAVADMRLARMQSQAVLSSP